jgi:DNA integrity scanning protein DisA with diadenylate cyclase activity
MRLDVLIQNMFYLFVLAIVLEVAIMAVFSMTLLRDVSENRSVKIARDVIVIILAWMICYKSNLFNIFTGTGINLVGARWYRLDVIISALVLAGFTNIVGYLIDRLRRG